MNFKSIGEASLFGGIQTIGLEADNQVIPSPGSTKESQVSFMRDYQEALAEVEAEYREESLR